MGPRGPVQQQQQRHHDPDEQAGEGVEQAGEEQQGEDGEAATTSPDTWERAPAEPFTAVLERLPFTTMPLDRPDPRLAAPRPSSSRLASTS